MNMLFINTFFCRIYGFFDTMIVRIRALSVFGYFPLTIVNIHINIYIYIYIYIYI